MFVRFPAPFIPTVVCVILTLTWAVKGQETTPTPSSKRGPPAEQESSAVPVPSPEVDFWRRETITGDWGETRARWKERGIEMEFTLAGFVQGTTSGGLERDTGESMSFQTCRPLAAQSEKEFSGRENR